MICQSTACQLVTLVIVTYLSSTVAIRVDWNTNTGPIIPPTSTIPPVPKPPFREPAPVWEDQSHDIPNPNTYKYVPPPPSRPKLNNPDDDRQIQLQKGQQQQQNQHKIQLHQSSTATTSTAATPTPTSTLAPTYGTIVYHPNQIQDVNKPVSSLAVQYIPNYGNQYVAVVPTYQKADYLNENNVYDNSGKYDKYDKYNDRYLAKLRKYKAYEQQKVKYVPYYQPVIYIACHSCTFYIGSYSCGTYCRLPGHKVTCDRSTFHNNRIFTNNFPSYSHHPNGTNTTATTHENLCCAHIRGYLSN